MRLSSVLLTPVLIFAMSSQPCRAAERALIIGNGAYEALERLDGAKNDALRATDILKGYGFQVVTATDATNGAMRAALQSFAEGLTTGDTAVVYFSGHVFQSQGRNFLLPVTARLRSETDLTTQAIAFSSVLAVLQRQPLRLGLVTIDGAFKTKLAEAGQVKPGVAAIEAPERNLVVFLAAPPNEVVPIRPGPSSAFGRSLLTQLSQEPVVVGTLVAQVTDSVIRATGGAQKPWSYSTLAGPTPLREPPGERPVVGKADAPRSDGALPKAAIAPPPAAVPPAEAPPAAVPTLAYGLRDLITFDGTLAHEERMAIQRRLQQMDYYHGEIDGVFGTQTRQAIRAYQEEIGAQRTGYLTPEQLNALL